MEMENFGHQSKLRNLAQHSSKAIELQRDIETNSVANAPYPMNNSVELACSTLRELQEQVSDEPELVRGTKELINFMQNLRISPPGPTADEQLQALHPIRHWVPWLPRSLIRLSDREPLVLVFLAHYHMVVLAVESILPAAPNFLLTSKRVEFIERLETAIGQVYRPTEKLPKQPGTRRRRESLENLMSGPAAFARQWRLTNLLASECAPLWGSSQSADQGTEPQWQDPDPVDFTLYKYQ
ncbi:unnamed protein product [Aureobasidium uvarum]|uniref:Uncharacterized protein n=1 Tax=Aureobasidium uvarum TaxID=2773716 RepID=A0A9N8KML2_9PEZI|nr:unnamed protein product [Aureobasidium uvarum]